METPFFDKIQVIKINTLKNIMLGKKKKMNRKNYTYLVNKMCLALQSMLIFLPSKNSQSACKFWSLARSFFPNNDHNLE